jgi:predicted nucleic acid-binding protein
VSLSTWEGFGPLVKSFMTENVFVDTNVLIYAHDADSGNRQRSVQQLLRDRTGVLSTQILEEFYATITRKMWRTIPRAKARQLLSGYARWLVEVITPADVVAASELEERYQLSFWDALVVITARKAEVARLVSEDFQHGQTILGVRIENPFRA